MTMKVEDEKGEMIEVYTAAEVAERETAAKTAVEGEYKPKLTAAESEKARLEGLLEVRSGEFKEFRRLSDEQKTKLSAAELVNYENTLIIQKEREERAKLEKDSKEKTVKAAIKSKAGTDDKLAEKMQTLYDAVNVEANTPEEIEKKVGMVLGAIGATEPDLLANVAGFSGGSYTPPQPKKDEKSFGETDAGKAMANELGLKLEADKK